MIFEANHYESYYYYFKNTASLKDEVDRMLCPIVKSDLLMSVKFICGMTPDDLRLFEDTSQADFPCEENGAVTLATIWCYQDNVSLWNNIKDFEEIFPNLHHWYQWSIETFWKEAIDDLYIHNRANIGREVKDRIPWIFWERKSKLYVPKTNVNKFNQKKIAAFLDEDTITV